MADINWNEEVVGHQYEEEFTSSGTWTFPSGYTEMFVDIILVGAGGGGSSSGHHVTYGNVSGAGGAGGQVIVRESVKVTGDLTVTIGANGSGGSTPASYGDAYNSGTDGGDTSVSNGGLPSTVTAKGGTGGGGPIGGTGGAGGTQSSGGSSGGAPGGNGGNGGLVSTPTPGASGDGNHCPGYALGGDRGAENSYDHGGGGGAGSWNDGGDGGDYNADNATAATGYGGGGGGGGVTNTSTNYPGKNGADGFAIIRWRQ